ncbi:lantibiotic dehydratase [Janthinobacterium psychrotolerans]|uniref:Thiopeptide-type bacteriocin biosynthesis domain-containing protein n=1 Tax=Janthinobacterium psychrotolerans TaxID=1747903 RepID=A0A1A7BXR2_9BURK|nr:lantibiotic dehydratase [Janthinobacterium psychrotolerans]OBV38401.1 thiopeptide-type bacteriocin biosynthesis domain-containing protein [Janthinobacterium psychrotolerans]
MKDKNQLTHQGFFHLRTPLLGMEVIKRWAQADDRTTYVFAAFKSPLLREALYLASRSLYDRLEEYEAAPASSAEPMRPALTLGGKTFLAPGLKKDSSTDKLVTALSRYLARASFRCTPYGMFSTVSTGRVAGATDLSGIASAPVVRHIHYDFGFESRLLEQANADPVTRDKVSYRPNPNLNRYAQKYYCAEAKMTNDRKTYVLSAVEQSEELELALSAAEQGVSLGELTELLARRFDVSREEAHAYASELIDSQLLVSPLGVPISGGRRLLSLHQQLQQFGQQGHTQSAVSALQSLRAQAAAMPLDSLVSGYRQTQQTLFPQGGRKDVPRVLFQVDCQRRFVPTLSEAQVAELTASAQALTRLLSEPSEVFSDHKRLFQERFSDQEVPLDLALHSEHGIPFPTQTRAMSPLLDGIHMPTYVSGNTYRSSMVDKLLINKLELCQRAGLNTIDITEQDLNVVRRHSPRVPPIPEGLFIQAMLLHQDVDNAPKYVIQMLAGRSGVEMLGRFTSFDDELLACVRTMLKKQQQQEPHGVYAEIIHDAQIRLNNIVSRPALRDYEIVISGASEAPAERQIRLSDLTVRLENGQYKLRSRRLNQDILPRMSTAHWYGRGNLDVYQFLCQLQNQDRPALGPFRWSDVFDALRRTPRVVYANTVWASAKWRFDGRDRELLMVAAGDEESMRDWIARHELPRFVTLDAGDNSLPIDLYNPVLVAMLLEEIGKSARWELSECIALNQAGEDAIFNSEVVLPFVMAPATPHAVEPAQISSLPARAQTRNAVYPPGSAWTYFKLYCGPLEADDLLLGVVAPVLEAAEREGLIDRWFYIRYADPKTHLRVRFHAAVAANRAQVMQRMSAALQPAIDNQSCNKVVIDTYEQETLRYGGRQAAPLAEQLFALDTALVTRALAQAQRELAPHERWLIALLGIEAWLQAFALEPAEALSLMEHMSVSFKSEFSIRAPQKIQLGAKYRSYRKQIEAYFFGGAQHQFASLAQQLVQQARTSAAQLRAWSEQGELTATLQDIIGSLIHMHCNRVIATDQRRHEVVLYDFMVRILESRRSRQRKLASAA